MNKPEQWDVVIRVGDYRAETTADGDIRVRWLTRRHAEAVAAAIRNLVIAEVVPVYGDTTPAGAA